MVAAMRAAALAGLVLVGSEHRLRRRTRCDPRPARSGALVVAQPADVLALDPVRVTDSESIEVGELLFEGLVHLAPGTSNIEPSLATAWEVSPDARRWTFHVRAA